LWDRFCLRHGVTTYRTPLFAHENGVVRTAFYGRRHPRPILQRSAQMEQLVINQVGKVISDYDQPGGRYEGLIYMMYRVEAERAVPLYIGKSEKYGRSGGNLSENIRNIERNKEKFCRWGHSYAYHIGDLSAAACPGHEPHRITTKYRRWAAALFKEVPVDSPELKAEAYFWVKAWERGEVGIWEEFGATSLTFLEYLLIGVASDLFPTTLLNEEGVNRR
jgi:hypothetical protein